MQEGAGFLVQIHAEAAGGEFFGKTFDETGLHEPGADPVAALERRLIDVVAGKEIEAGALFHAVETVVVFAARRCAERFDRRADILASGEDGDELLAVLRLRAERAGFEERGYDGHVLFMRALCIRAANHQNFLRM